MFLRSANRVSNVDLLAVHAYGPLSALLSRIQNDKMAARGHQEEDQDKPPIAAKLSPEAR